MKREPEIVLEADGNTFSHTSQLEDNAAFHARNRRLRSAQEKRAINSYPLKWLANYARLERADVAENIRQFWHEVSACTAKPQSRKRWQMTSYTGTSIRLGP